MLITLEVNRISFTVSYDGKEFYHNKKQLEHKSIVLMFDGIFKLGGSLVIQLPMNDYKRICNLDEFKEEIPLSFSGCGWLSFELSFVIDEELTMGEIIDMIIQNEDHINYHCKNSLITIPIMEKK